jgi:CRISPR-associated protein Csb1
VFGKRFVDGEPQHAVLIDSSQSQSNRMEAALSLAITDGDPVLGLIPRIRVVYQRDGGDEPYTDLELPHRAFDAHVRAATVDGHPVTDSAVYRAARNATQADALALFNLSPVSMVFGAWDSTRSARQGRWPA